MKNLLPDAIGTAGLCLFVSGLYSLFGLGVAQVVAGVLLMTGAFLAGMRIKAGGS